MLTGKAKEGFDKWLIKNNKEIISVQDIGFKQTLSITDVFRLLPFSMQYGVYVDYLNTFRYEDENMFDYLFNYYSKNGIETQDHNDWIKQAIKAADEIINNK